MPCVGSVRAHKSVGDDSKEKANRASQPAASTHACIIFLKERKKQVPAKSRAKTPRGSPGAAPARPFSAGRSSESARRCRLGEHRQVCDDGRDASEDEMRALLGRSNTISDAFGPLTC